MRVLLLVCCLLSLASLQEAPNLHRVASDLSTISRLVKGISIQNELSEKKTNEIEVLAGMIEIDDPKALEDLKGINTAESMKQLDEVSGALKSLGPSSIKNPDNLRKNLKILPGFFSQLDLMERASQKTLTDDFKTKAEAVIGAGLSIRDTSIGNLKIVLMAEALTQIFDKNINPLDNTDNDTISSLKAAINHIREGYDGYQDYIVELKNYENEAVLKDLLAYGNLNITEVLEPVMQLKELAFKYDNLKLADPEMVVWLKALKEEVDKVESSNFQNIEDQMKALTAELDKLLPLAKHLSSVKPGLKSTQFSKVFESDLSSKWFLKNFAEGNAKSIEKLKKALTPLSSFSVKATQALQGLTDFSKRHDLFKVFALKRIVASAEESMKKMQDYKQFSATIKQSLDGTIQCLETEVLMYPRKAIDFEKFEEVYKFSIDFHERVNFMHKSVQQLLAMPEIENYDMIKKIRNGLTANLENKGFRMKKHEVWTTFELMRNVTGSTEFVENFKKAGDLLSKIDFMELEYKMNETVEFDVIQSVQEVLADTNLIPTLQCLKNITSVFDPDHALKLMQLGDKFRSLKEEDILEAKTILENMEKIKGTLNGLVEAKKSKRAAEESGEKELLKFKEAKKVTEKLENGVDSLNKLMEVINKKKTVMEATSFGDKVDQAVLLIRMPPMQTVWTTSIRQKMQGIYKEVDELEKMSGNYKSLEDQFEIFENATIVNGLELDMDLFSVPMAASLMSSQDGDIQKAAPVFEKLSSLDLNFAVYQGSLIQASQTLPPVRKFFDDFFGIDRTVKNGTAMGQTGEDGREGAAADGSGALRLMVLAIGALLVLVLIILIIFWMKRRSRVAKLALKTTWRHLRFLSEGALTRNEGTQYTQLHLAVHKKRLEEVKKLVKNGAYVDVHCVGKINETPLHTAVSNKSVEIVKFLIKNGADVNALDSNYETPLDLAKGNKAIQEILKAAKKKSYRKTLPQSLPVDKYKIFIDESVKGKKEFADCFKANIVNKLDKATHVIVKTGKDGTYEMDKEDPSALMVLGVVCSPKMLMSSDWMNASVQNKSSFRDDFKFQVKKIKFNGKTYKGIDDIQLDHSKMKVPFLTNATIHFDQADLHTIDWSALKTIAIELGAQNVDEFPMMQGMMAGKCPYYRDDLGHIFVIYNQSNADKLTALYPILKTDKAYTFLEKDEFITLLLERQISHKKMPGAKKNGKKNSKTSKSKSKSSEESGGGTTGDGTTGTTGGTTGELTSGSATPITNSATPTPESKTPAVEENKTE